MVFKITIRGDKELLKELDAFDMDVRKFARKAAKDVAEEGVRILKQNVPTQTRHLKDSIRRTSSNKGWRQEISMATYGLFVDRGTRPHSIPKNTRTEAYAILYGLPFWAFWRAIYRKGTQANPFIDESFAQLNKKTNNILLKRLESDITLLR